MTSFDPRLDVLPPAQRALWPELACVPRGFVLYGGTALALRLGHRQSVDFDFFSPDPLDRRALDRLPLLEAAAVLQEGPDTLTVSVQRGAPVKLSFFGPVGFGRVGDPSSAGGVIAVASPLDLAATKLKVLLQRVEAKDYLDVAALLRAAVPLRDMLRAARSLFGDAFNPLVAQRTLAWFEDEALSSLDAATRDLLTRASLDDVELLPMPRRSERLG
ncbi:MAG: nucleotidyl transferase AbiEii/AbiGii toxin family protein [Myxococcales bacterium]